MIASVARIFTITSLGLAQLRTVHKSVNYANVTDWQINANTIIIWVTGAVLIVKIMPMAIVAKNASPDFSKTLIQTVVFHVTVILMDQRRHSVMNMAFVTVTMVLKVTNVTGVKTVFITWPEAVVTLVIVTLREVSITFRLATRKLENVDAKKMFMDDNVEIVKWVIWG